MAKNIGIDLGTTNSCISYLEGREAVVIPNPEGSRVIASIVALNRERMRIFGNVAKRQFITNNKNTQFGCCTLRIVRTPIFHLLSLLHNNSRTQPLDSIAT